MSKFQNSFEIPESILKDTKKLNEFLEQAYNSFCVNYFNQIKDLIEFSQVRIEKTKENRKINVIVFTANEANIKIKDEIKKHGNNYKIDVSKKIKVSTDKIKETENIENEDIKNEKVKK